MRPIKESLVPHEAAVSYLLLNDEDKMNCNSYQLPIKRNPFKSIEVNIPAENKKPSKKNKYLTKNHKKQPFHKSNH